MMEQMSMFDFLKPERNPLLDEITKDKIVKYAKSHRYGDYIDDWLFDYVANNMISAIEHYSYIKQGYKSVEQILGLINVKIHELCFSRTWHNSNDKIKTYSIKKSGKYSDGKKWVSYDLFILYDKYILIRQQLDYDVFEQFRFPNLYYKIYDEEKKEYIINPDTRQKILEDVFNIREYSLDDEHTLLTYITLTDMVKYLGGNNVNT